MTDRLTLSEYKRLTSQMSVAPGGRVVRVAKPRPEFAAAFAKATHVLHKPQTLPASVRPNKYGAKKTLVDGITFDSKLEARRYVQLMEMLRHGGLGTAFGKASFEFSRIDDQPHGFKPFTPVIAAPARSRFADAQDF